jgi:hypothetical protein
VKRRLVLHLGLWKTGTTTIQSFLRGHPDLLAEIGVHYPQVGPDNPDHPFFNPRPSTDFMAREVSHQFLGQELAGRRRRMATDHPLWSTALRRIEDSGAQTAIISYEDFSAQVAHYHFGPIADRLKAFDVTGIIYLRPQEPWAVSLFAHFVRGARTSDPFARFVDGIGHRLVYSSLLDQIRGHIPLDRLVVRDFEEAVRTGLIEDFFASLDLTNPIGTANPGRNVRNKSLPSWAVLFLLRCLQAPLPTGSLAEVRKVLIGRAMNGRPPPLRPGLDLASPEERARLRAMTRADAARLAGDYGIAFAQPDAPPPYRPFERDDFDIIRGVIAPRLSEETRVALAAI